MFIVTVLFFSTNLSIMTLKENKRRCLYTGTNVLGSGFSREPCAGLAPRRRSVSVGFVERSSWWSRSRPFAEMNLCIFPVGFKVFPFPCLF